MLSDLENLDITVGSNHFEREDSDFGNSARRPESPSYDALADHNTNSHSNSGENEIEKFAGKGHNSRKVYFRSEINRLPGELNRRITQEKNDLMRSVSSQLQRAISEAVNEQVLPRTQVSLRSGSRQFPQKGWNAPTDIKT